MPACAQSTGPAALAEHLGNWSRDGGTDPAAESMAPEPESVVDDKARQVLSERQPSPSRVPRFCVLATGRSTHDHDDNPCTYNPVAYVPGAMDGSCRLLTSDHGQQGKGKQLRMWTLGECHPYYKLEPVLLVDEKNEALNVSGGATAVACSADGRFAISASAMSIFVWKWKDCHQNKSCAEHATAVAPRLVLVATKTGPEGEVWCVTWREHLGTTVGDDGDCKGIEYFAGQCEYGAKHWTYSAPVKRWVPKSILLLSSMVASTCGVWWLEHGEPSWTKKVVEAIYSTLESIGWISEDSDGAPDGVPANVSLWLGVVFFSMSYAYPPRGWTWKLRACAVSLVSFLFVYISATVVTPVPGLAISTAALVALYGFWFCQLLGDRLDPLPPRLWRQALHSLLWTASIVLVAGMVAWSFECVQEARDDDPKRQIEKTGRRRREQCEEQSVALVIVASAPVFFVVVNSLPHLFTDLHISTRLWKLMPAMIAATVVAGLVVQVLGQRWGVWCVFYLSCALMLLHVPGLFTLLWSAVTHVVSDINMKEKDESKQTQKTAHCRFFATGGWDKKIKLWKLEGENVSEIATISGHTGRVKCLACARAARKHGEKWLLASGSEDHSCVLWDWSQKLKLLTLWHSASVEAVAFASDGSVLVTGCGDGLVRIFDANADDEPTALLRKLKGHRGAVNSVVYAPRDIHIVSGSADGSVRVWNATSGACERELRVGARIGVLSVGVAPDTGGIVVGCSDGRARVWNLRAGLCDRHLRGHKKTVSCICVSPDGERFATGSFDGSVKVWGCDGQEQACLTHPKHTKWVLSIAWAPDSEHLISGTTSQNHLVSLWRVPRGDTPVSCVRDLPFGESGNLRNLAVQGQQAQRVVWSKTATRGNWPELIVVGCGKHRPCGPVVFGAQKPYNETGNVQRLFDLPAHKHWVPGIAVSPRGDRLVSSSWDKSAIVWSLRDVQDRQDNDSASAIERCRQHTLKGHRDFVRCVAFSPCGKRILTGSDDTNAILWEAEEGKSLGELLSTLPHEGAVWAVGFAPAANWGALLVLGRDEGVSERTKTDDPVMYTGTYDNCLRFWERQVDGTARCVRTVSLAFAVTDVAFVRGIGAHASLKDQAMDVLVTANDCVTVLDLSAPPETTVSPQDLWQFSVQPDLHDRSGSRTKALLSRLQGDGSEAKDYSACLLTRLGWDAQIMSLQIVRARLQRAPKWVGVALSNAVKLKSSDKSWDRNKSLEKINGEAEERLKRQLRIHCGLDTAEADMLVHSLFALPTLEPTHARVKSLNALLPPEERWSWLKFEGHKSACLSTCSNTQVVDYTLAWRLEYFVSSAYEGLQEDRSTGSAPGNCICRSQTALHRAVAVANDDLTQVLLEARGADEAMVVGFDERGTTPWNLAIKRYSLGPDRIGGMGYEDLGVALRNRLGEQMCGNKLPRSQQSAYMRGWTFKGREEVALLGVSEQGQGARNAKKKKNVLYLCGARELLKQIKLDPKPAVLQESSSPPPSIAKAGAEAEAEAEAVFELVPEPDVPKPGFNGKAGVWRLRGVQETGGTIDDDYQTLWLYQQFDGDWCLRDEFRPHELACTAYMQCTDGRGGGTHPPLEQPQDWHQFTHDNMNSWVVHKWRWTDKQHGTQQPNSTEKSSKKNSKTKLSQQLVQLATNFSHPLMQLAHDSKQVLDQIDGTMPLSDSSARTFTNASLLIPNTTRERQKLLETEGGRGRYLHWARQHQLMRRVENLPCGAYLGAAFSQGLEDVTLLEALAYHEFIEFQANGESGESFKGSFAQALVSFKWKQFGHRIFHLELCWYCTLLLVHVTGTLFAWMATSADVERAGWATKTAGAFLNNWHHDIWRVHYVTALARASEIVLAARFLYMEAQQLRHCVDTKQRNKEHLESFTLQEKHLDDGWNYIQMVTLIATIIAAGLDLCCYLLGGDRAIGLLILSHKSLLRHGALLRFCRAISGGFLWIGLLCSRRVIKYYMRGFRSTAPAAPIISQIVQDAMPYLLYLFVFLAGFTSMFLNLQGGVDGPFPGAYHRDERFLGAYDSPLSSVWTVFGMMMGDFDATQFMDADGLYVSLLEAVKILLFALFLIVVQVVLLNLLIGIMSASIEKVRGKVVAVVSKERAGLIMDFEELRLSPRRKLDPKLFPRIFKYKRTQKSAIEAELEAKEQEDAKNQEEAKNTTIEDLREKVKGLDSKFDGINNTLAKILDRLPRYS